MCSVYLCVLLVYLCMYGVCKYHACMDTYMVRTRTRLEAESRHNCGMPVYGVRTRALELLAYERIHTKDPYESIHTSIRSTYESITYEYTYDYIHKSTQEYTRVHTRVHVRTSILYSVEVLPYESIHESIHDRIRSTEYTNTRVHESKTYSQ